MTADHSGQPDQRIWPEGTPEAAAADAAPPQRLASAIARLRHALASFSTPPGILTTHDGVTFRPLARTSLEHALSPAGPGHLDFAVAFPAATHQTRSRMKIRATPQRQFHDLLPADPFFQRLIRAASAAARPGDRVLIFGAGTGALAAHIAEHVGPSGAVTSFEADAQSVAFARARYTIANAAHERLNAASLAAEPPAAAETIIITPNAPKPDLEQLLNRLARPGRLLLLGEHAPLAEFLRGRPGFSIQIVAGDSQAVLVNSLPRA